jgi:hypothetical protein
LSYSAALAWLVLLGGIVAYVVFYDVWAYRSGHLMMTTQFRLWLANPVSGPIISGFWVGLWVGLTSHLFLRFGH